MSSQIPTKIPYLLILSAHYLLLLLLLTAPTLAIEISNHNNTISNNIFSPRFPYPATASNPTCQSEAFASIYCPWPDTCHHLDSAGSPFCCPAGNDCWSSSISQPSTSLPPSSTETGYPMPSFVTGPGGEGGDGQGRVGGQSVTMGNYGDGNSINYINSSSGNRAGGMVWRGLVASFVLSVVGWCQL